MPQQKTLFLSSVSQIITNHPNLKLSKGNFALTYPKTSKTIPLDELFQIWSEKDKSEREAFLQNYFQTLTGIVEEAHFQEKWHQQIDSIDTTSKSALRESMTQYLIRARHISALGHNPFVSTELEVRDQKDEAKHVEIGMHLVCETEAKETKNANVLVQKEWLDHLNKPESEESDDSQAPKITKDLLISSAMENLSKKFKPIQRNWKLCEIKFSELPEKQKEYFYLSDYKDVYVATRVLLYPDQVLPKEVIESTRSGETSWVLIVLGDDMVALAKSTDRWALLQISEMFLVPRLSQKQEPSSKVTQCKALRLISLNKYLQWQVYSPDYKNQEGFPPRSELELQAIKQGMVQQLQQQGAAAAEKQSS